MKDENENNQTNKESGNFGLPEGYFEKSANSIFNKIEWRDEHKEFPKLLEVKNTNGFIVPENYFSKNEQRLELIQYPILNSIQNKSAFVVPENYFEEAETCELAIVLKEEEDELTGFEKLRSLKKQNSFSISENYFSEQENRLLQILQKPEQVKVISLFSKRIAYAVAALFVVVMGVWIYNFYFTPIQVQDCGTIACVDKQDLVKTKNLERLDDDQLYELVDPSVLEKKLKNSETKKNNKEDQDSSLNNISTDELLDDI